MEKINFENITIDEIALPANQEKDIRVSVLRLDKIHPIISGNKFFKIRFYIDEALKLQKKTIVTFGGAYSNHIVATASVCKLNNLNSIGIIRGEKANEISPTLSQAEDLGMKLHFISRKEYKEKKIPAELIKDDHYFINEGGFGEKGVEGASTILDHCIKNEFTHYCCAVGTGTMIAGLIKASLPGQSVAGISVMKNNFELENNVKNLTGNKKDFQIIHDYHFGGYAKYKPDLIQFMNEFYHQTHIPSDFVYTGKLFYGINNLILKNFFPDKSNLLFIHSGGLQGNSSLKKGTLIF
jgi:1-aminocyclopropane-1-carboxylate deaminase